MKRMGLMAVLAALALVFSGCDDDSSAEAKEYDRQMALNDGNYAEVLSMTENCGADYACQMDRAAAYAGRAGFSLSTVIAGLTDEDESDSFYAKLAASASDTARDDLNLSKTVYEGIIEADGGLKENVCNKAHPDYAAASYYQQAACFPHGMTVMAKTAILMESIKDAPDPDDSQEVAELLNGDINTLVNLFGDGSADTVDAVNEVKDEVCAAGGKPAGCTITDTDVDAYVAAN